MFNNLSLDDKVRIYEDNTGAIVEHKNGIWTISTPEATETYSTKDFNRFLDYELECAFMTNNMWLIDSISLEDISREESNYAVKVDGVEDNRVYLSF